MGTPLGKCPARAGPRRPTPTVPGQEHGGMRASWGSNDRKPESAVFLWAIQLRVKYPEDGIKVLMVCGFGREEERREKSRIWGERCGGFFDHLFPGDSVIIAVSSSSRCLPRYYFILCAQEKAHFSFGNSRLWKPSPLQVEFG